MMFNQKNFKQGKIGEHN